MPELYKMWQECSTSNVDFSRLLKSMRIVIWNVETCRMCFLALEPVTWAPPTISEPSSWRRRKSNYHSLDYKTTKSFGLLVTACYLFDWPVEGGIEVCWTHVMLQCELPTAVLGQIKSAIKESRVAVSACTKPQEGLWKSKFFPNEFT